MDEKVKMQQRLFMRYNLVAFTIIFGVFAAIVYLQIQTSLYSRLDDDLYHTRHIIQENAEFLDSQINLRYEEMDGGFRAEIKSPGKFPSPDKEPPHDSPPPEGTQIFRMRTAVPMRVQVIVRDKAGLVQNSVALGRLFLENLIEAVPFSPERTDSIQSFKLEDGSHYRSLTFTQQASNGELYYVQLLVGADGEQGIIDQFFQILIVCVIVCIVVSIVASIMLSRKTMGPIIRSWERQTEFVENASHELRTPLTIIQNKLESLLITPNATVLDKADNIAISLSETRRLSKLTTDLMTLARADSSELQLQKENFLLDDLVRTVSGPYGELAESQEKEMVLELGCATPISADRSRIHELMVILLDNALKYTKGGGSITISTAVKDHKCVIRVADTGIGIREESRERIFDRFYREDKARSREHGGTGLGLSIASWIVDSHGGTIKAEANHPAGTVFVVQLPL